MVYFKIKRNLFYGSRGRALCKARATIRTTRFGPFTGTIVFTHPRAMPVETSAVRLIRRFSAADGWYTSEPERRRRQTFGLRVYHPRRSRSRPRPRPKCRRRRRRRCRHRRRRRHYSRGHSSGGADKRENVHDLPSSVTSQKTNRTANWMSGGGERTRRQDYGRNGRTTTTDNYCRTDDGGRK